MPLTHESAIPIAILFTGGGSTMEKIIHESLSGGRLYGRIKPAVLISSRLDNRGYEIAKGFNRDHGIPVEVIQRKEFEKGEHGHEAFGDALISVFNRHGATLFSQNGWLPWTPEKVANEFEGYNQHPVPLDPDHLASDGTPLHFGGKGVHGLAAQSAVLKFQRLAQRSFPTEATIHRVSPQVDGGFVVYRRAISVLSEDTPETLAQRVLPEEHDIQILFWNERYNGLVSSLSRRFPLIYDDEEPFLKKAILYGRETYPNG